MTLDHDDETRLKIGAVSRLTGLSVHTVRKWEERYGAVTPIRTARGQRLYSREDVRRLALIRRLTQAGLPLNDIAGAPTSRLERTAGSMAPETRDALVPAAPLRSVRVVVVGDALPAQLDNAGHTAGALRVVATENSLAAASTALGELDAELLICELSTVRGNSFEEVSEAMTACRVKAAVVVYGFGMSTHLSTLRRVNIALMRAPVDSGNLQRTALGLMLELGLSVGGQPLGAREPEVEDIPEPRFSRKAIARAVKSSPSIQCECPHHIADLLFSLRSFEDYSEQCETDHPDDAALHRYLKVTAGISRAAFEEALARVADAEGITLES